MTYTELKEIAQRHNMKYFIRAVEIYSEKKIRENWDLKPLADWQNSGKLTEDEELLLMSATDSNVEQRKTDVLLAVLKRNRPEAIKELPTTPIQNAVNTPTVLSANASEAVGVQNIATDHNGTAPQATAQPTAPPKNNNTAIVLLIVIVIAAFFYFKNRD